MFFYTLIALVLGVASAENFECFNGAKCLYSKTPCSIEKQKSEYGGTPFNLFVSRGRSAKLTKSYSSDLNGRRLKSDKWATKEGLERYSTKLNMTNGWEWVAVEVTRTDSKKVFSDWVDDKNISIWITLNLEDPLQNFYVCERRE